VITLAVVVGVLVVKDEEVNVEGHVVLEVDELTVKE
jgi:hypothetical protein